MYNSNIIINYIYLLQEREFIKTNENIFKIGMTTKKNYERFNQYPKGSILLFQIICNNCKHIEKIIIKIFKEKFIQRKEVGTEYFEGNYKIMIDIIYLILNKRNKIDLNENEIELYEKKIEVNENEIELYEIELNEIELNEIELNKIELNKIELNKIELNKIELNENHVKFNENKVVLNEIELIYKKNNIIKKNYECKRCFYNCNQLNDMKKHLNKKTKCINKLELFNYKDDELYNLSLINKNKIYKGHICNNCKKSFSTSSNLSRHLSKIICKNIDSKDDKIILK